MSGVHLLDTPGSLPKGYTAIPVSPEQKVAPLRICVLVKFESDPIAGQLVVVRNTIDAQVLLACIMDAGDRLHQWLELWVQDLDGLARTVAASRGGLTNSALDERWKRHVRALEKYEPGGMIKTGWETIHPAPTFLDLTRLESVQPTDSKWRTPWILCRDDTLLEEKGLPPYSSTLHRYLYLPTDTKDPKFISVTADCPTNEFTIPLSEVINTGNLVPLNPGAGMLMVRPHSPVSYEDFTDILSGAKWQGTAHGRTILDLSGSGGSLLEGEASVFGEGRLFLEAHGRAGKLVEALHLKLRLLSDAVSAARRLVYYNKRPLLNLSADSFAITLGAPAQGLPFMWTAKCALVETGDALSLRLETSDTIYYVRPSGGKVTTYQPRSAGPPTSGEGTVRIRGVLPDAGDGMTILEGTLATQDPVKASRSDLVWIRLNLFSGRTDIYAHLEDETSLSAGEYRFRTIGQRFSPEWVQALRASEGVPTPKTHFEIIPLLTTPCDLYSLGVLAVRTLLVDDQTTLPVALDEAHSLAHELAQHHDRATPLGERIGAVFGNDDRWKKSLGPQRLTREALSPEDTFGIVPSELWWDVLAMIVRMFPGMGPDSVCRDFGNAPAGGLHRVFDKTLADLERLLAKTRSLVVIDWRSNREITSVLRDALASNS